MDSVNPMDSSHSRLLNRSIRTHPVLDQDRDIGIAVILTIIITGPLVRLPCGRSGVVLRLVRFVIVAVEFTVVPNPRLSAAHYPPIQGM